jgi:hypothetical protein
MNFADYRALPGVNWSTLKHMAESPLEYQYALAHPSPYTDAMRFGKLVHCAVLEPRELPLRYVTWDGSRRSKDYREFEAVAIDAGREVVTVAEYMQAEEIVEAVANHPVARKYLEGAATEVTWTWTDEATGLPCKCRVDAVSSRYLTDVKSTYDISPYAIRSTVARFKYHAQVAHYQHGCAAATGKTRHVKLLFVKTRGAADVACFDVGEDELWAGEEEVAALLRKVADCTQSGTWPGRYPDEVPLTLPDWVYKEVDEL